MSVHRESSKQKKNRLTMGEKQGALYARTLSSKNSKRAGAVVAERLVISSIQ